MRNSLTRGIEVKSLLKMNKQIVCFFIITSVVFCLGDAQVCKTIRTRILNEGDTFEPQRCFICQCRNSSLSCKDRDPAECPEPPCEPEVQISTPDRCCKICPGVGSRCWFNGMTVEDGESFQLNPSGSCECHNGKLTCVGRHTINRHSLTTLMS